jgi:uncharacterized membrane protein
MAKIRKSVNINYVLQMLVNRSRIGAVGGNSWGAKIGGLLMMDCLLYQSQIDY